MLLKPCPISSDLFSFRKESNTFTTDASDLGGLFRLGRVWDDAFDEGLTIISRNTGHPVVFVKSHVQYDPDGDLMAYHFTAVTPGFRYLKAVIYND